MELRPDQKKTGFVWDKNGKLYFSKMTERKVFFVATMIMLLLGMLTWMGIL